MSLNVVNTEFDRRKFDKLNSFYGKKGLTPQLSILRIEQDLVDGKGVYQINLKKEGLNGCESRLERNDLFVVKSIGIATRIEDPTRPDITVPNFSPLLGKVYDNSGSDVILTPGFATDDIFALYNGKLSITTGTIVNFSDMPLALFLKQQSDDITKTSTSNAPFTANEIRSKKFDFENDMVTLAEEVIFAGTQDHKILVSFPTYAGANYKAVQAATSGTPTTDYKTKLVFMALGWRVIGGTNEDYKVDNNPYAEVI